MTGSFPLQAKAFLEDYKKKGNIVRIKVLSNSSAVWAISPPSRQFLIKELQSNASISIRFKYEFSRYVSCYIDLAKFL